MQRWSLVKEVLWCGSLGRLVSGFCDPLGGLVDSVDGAGWIPRLTEAAGAREARSGGGRVMGTEQSGPLPIVQTCGGGLALRGVSESVGYFIVK